MISVRMMWGMKEKPPNLATALQLNLPEENFRISDHPQDDIVESFSRGFQADLQRILGDSYHPRPMDEESDGLIKGQGHASRGSGRKSTQ